MADGKCAGILVGITEGTNVGTAVGVAVGPFVGTTDGRSVGDKDVGEIDIGANVDCNGFRTDTITKFRSGVPGIASLNNES